MPAKIGIEKLWRRLAECVDPTKTILNLTKTDFEDMVLGFGIASSRQTIKSLWAQARFAEYNVYTGNQPRILLDMNALREAFAGKCVYTYTHSSTNPKEVA